MAFDQGSPKHKVMRELLAELGVAEPENDAFYSRGSTVATEALKTALQSLKRHKREVGELARKLATLAGE